jgi:hypothetical protein
MQGDTAKALAAYKDFLTLWKDAERRHSSAYRGEVRIREAEITSEGSLYAGELWGRKCMFCSLSLAEEDPYDLLEWDDGELVCGECYARKGGAIRANVWKKFHAMRTAEFVQ